MVKEIIVFMLIILVIGGCSYAFHSNAFPYLKRVQLIPFTNKSKEFGMGDLVLTRLSRDINDDGRLRTVTQQADCQLEGSILSYENKVYSYDEANNPQDKIVIVTFAYTFTDLKNNKVIYESKSTIKSETYALSALSTSRLKSEADAQREICDQLFNDIMQHTLEQW